jgi:hypothetical protein
MRQNRKVLDVKVHDIIINELKNISRSKHYIMVSAACCLSKQELYKISKAS